MQYIGEQLGVKTFEDWYMIGTREVRKAGGATVLEYYGGSIVKTVTSLFPEYPTSIVCQSRKKMTCLYSIRYNWQIASFKSIPKGFFDDINNQRAFMDQILASVGNRASIITRDLLFKNGGRSILKHHKTLASLLKATHPSIVAGTKRSKKLKSQEYLVCMLQEIFHNQIVFQNYNHPLLKYNSTSRILQTTIN
jgi:hypothetical protein